jgi:hypothetical protein
MSVYNELKYNVSFANAGGLVLLSTQTASSSASISFTSGLTSAYKEYLFIFNNIHPQTDITHFQFQGSTDGGSSYNTTITSTVFRAYHDETGTYNGIEYSTDQDLAQSTSYQNLQNNVGGDNDQCKSGILRIFNPSDTTFVKHFIYTGNKVQHNDFAVNNYIAGYFNTTSAINAVDFKFSSGNIDAGTIQMFGVVS